MSSYVKKFISNSILLAIASFFSLLLGYLLRLLLANKLSVDQFGLVYSIISLFTFFSLFQHLGLNAALAKYIAEFKVNNEYEKIKFAIISVFCIQLISSFLLGILFFVLSNYLAINYFNFAEAALYVKIYVGVIIFSPLFFSVKAIFQGFQDMKFFSIVELFKMAIIFVITFILLNLGFQTLSVFIAYLISIIVSSLFFLFILFSKTFPNFYKIPFKRDGGILKKLILFGLPILFTTLSSLIFGYIDTILLTFFRSMQEVAWYNSALPTSNIVAHFSLVFSFLLLPLTSELWKRKEYLKMAKGINILYKYVLIVILPLASLFFIFSELVLRVLFGPGYEGAVPVLKILSIGSIFIAFSILNGSILTGIGKPQIYGKIMFSMALFNIIADIILIPKFGINGAGFATLIAYMVIFLMSFFYLVKYIPIKIPIKQILLIFLLTWLFIGLIYFVKKIITSSNFIFEAIIVTLIAGVVYSGLLFLFRILTLREVTNLFLKKI
jgi:O-antigen/teichoic acid export membrane protein